MIGDIVTVSGGYFSRAVDDVDGIVADAKRLLADAPEFDTLVGTGLSGALIVPTLARALDVHWLLVRKPNDGTHGNTAAEGKLGARWLFVDDFIDSGATLERVTEVVGRLRPGAARVGKFLYQECLYDGDRGAVYQR